MSPKFCSLAYDELTEQDQELLVREPQLKIVKRQHLDSTPNGCLDHEDIIQIKGRMTVSF